MAMPAMRETARFRVVTFALLLGAFAAVAVGQEPKPAEVAPQHFEGGNGIELTRSWRFHPGDDPSWAEPTFDDTDWELVDPRMPPGKLPRGGWPGVGWFRRHLRVEPALWGRPLTMRLAQAGLAEVYLDGALIYRVGAFVAGETPNVARPRRGPWRVVFSARPDHVVAVRYSCTAAPASQRLETGIGFIVTLGGVSTDAVEWRAIAVQAALFTVSVFLALLHLAFYWFNPRTRENLFFAACMAVFALMVFRDFESARATMPSQMELLNRLAAPGPIALILFGLFTYYAVRTRPFPRTWMVFTVAAALLIPACFLDPETFSPSWYFYFAAMLAEIARVEVRGKTVKREGVTILLIGMAVQAVFVVLQLLINFGVVPPIGGISGVYVFGMLAFAVGMSLFLAHSFARTSFHLEGRLAEVQTLSSQLLEQERTAHARDLQTRLLEAENARKSKELEEGRALQLSMLPLSVPGVEGLDIAVAMITATEVGGDYYDFRSSPDGSLVIAVGDATGHGVAAGIMVTAVKAVLATVGGEPSLPTMLSECDRVVRGMNIKPLYMCLSVARVTPRSVAICSAAMPPVLICRATTGKVEEIGIGGLPLGGRLSPVYQEQSAPLAPGDTLLFATDGFHEVQDPDGKELGFERAAEALRGAAGKPAGEVVKQLMTTVANWRREREQADDITFVVVRVRQ
jgi:serine phosphatase RsbU (regulator of sigma subunit)